MIEVGEIYEGNDKALLLLIIEVSVEDKYVTCAIIAKHDDIHVYELHEIDYWSWPIFQQYYTKIS